MHLFSIYGVLLVFVVAFVVARDRLVRLRRSESKMRALFASMDGLIIIFDREGTYLEIAETSESLLLRPREETLGRRVRDVLPEECAAEVLRTIEKVLDEARPVQLDYRVKKGDRDMWFTATASPLNEEHVIWVARDITPRKLAEQDLERAHADLEVRMVGIIQQAKDVIFTFDLDGVITSLNPAFEEIVGWPAEEWIGRPFLELIDAKARTDAAELFRRVAAGHTPPFARVPLRGRDGRRIVFEASLTPRVIDGRQAGFLGMARDVTARERAEENLRRSQRQLADSEKIAKLGSWDYDLIRGTLTWSDQLYRIFGLDPQGEAITCDAFRELLSRDAARHIHDMQTAAIAGDTDEWEVPIRTQDGADRILSCRTRVARDTTGRALRIFGTAQDVTDARKAEQMLRESEERFRLLARATNDVMWDLNLVTQHVWWNEGLSTLFGYRPEDADHAGFRTEAIHPDDRQRVLDAITECIESGQISWSAEYRFRRSDDSYADVLDRGYIVRGSDLTPLRMVGAIMDITDRKQMEERLAQANRVSSLGRIAASIAHEFNNVLMGIQPNLEVIRRRTSGDVAVPLEHVLQSVRRGKRITDEILRFTRPATPALRCVDVAHFLDMWSHEITPVVGRNVTLELDAEPDLHIAADALQIAQVLTNLAVNARDAMREQGGTLKVTAQRVHSYSSLGFAVVPTPDRFVHFAITDTGSGMTKQQLAHLFEPLFTTKKGGTGLGLAVSYQIITRHEGFISAESTPGVGTTFHILLPQTLPMLDMIEEPAHALPSHARVLVVEDETAVSAGICLLLELEGMNTRVVDTGGAAMAAAEEFAPHAVILDIGLPDMSGVDVYARLFERWPRLPVLFSSGHAGAEKLGKILSRDNVALVVKPYDLATLRGTLGSLLQDVVH